MARLVSMDVYDLLSCAVCHEILKDPKVLACQHTFCTTCLISWSKKGTKSRMIECPECRTYTPLPSGLVSNLPSDFKIKQMIESLSQHDVSPKCICCTGGSGKDNKAEYYCKECQDYLCQYCKISHQRIDIFKGHHLIRKVGKLCLRMQCHDHAMKFQDYYCEQCSVLACSACVTVRHQQHEVYDLQARLKDRLKKTKANLTKLTNAFPDPISEGVLEKRGFEQIIADVEKNTNKVTEKIRATATLLTEDIKKQAYELTDLVTIHHDELLNKLERAEKIPEVVSLRKRCEALLESESALIILKEFKDLSNDIDILVPSDMNTEAPQLSIHADFVYKDFCPQLDISIGNLESSVLQDFIANS